MHNIQNNTILSSYDFEIESQASSLLKYKTFDGTPDHWTWTNSKTITNHTKELLNQIVKLISVPKGEIVI